MSNQPFPDTVRFLSLLDPQATAWTFQTFDDKPGKAPGLTRQLHGTLEKHAAELIRLNNQGAGVFVTIQETDLRGRDRSHIKRVRACFADFDVADPAKPDELRGFALVPSMIVESSPEKYHAYWLVADLALDQFTDLQKRIIHYWKSDPKPHDLARVMRLPGFQHHKEQPFQTRIIDAPGTLYTAAEMLEAFPPIAAPAERQQSPLLPHADPYAQAALERAVGAVACTQEGGRNDELNRQAFGLFGLVKAGRLNETHTRDALQRAGTDARLAPGEIKTTLESAWNKAKPRYEGLPSTPASSAPPDVWPEPMPLPKPPPVPDFPLRILPDDLKDYVADAADRVRFKPEFAAVPAMVALGSVIGRKLGFRPKQNDDWTLYANMWGATVGSPSTKKSPAQGEGLRQLKQLQVTADSRHAEELKQYTREKELYEMRQKARKSQAQTALKENPDAQIDLGDDPEPEAPTARAYWTQSVNDASLSVLLQNNPNGVLIERDELASLLVNLEREENAELRTMLLSGWDGHQGFRSDRIGRGVTYLPAYALSVVGGIQPGPLQRYVRSAFSGEKADGLLQRFQLLVWPEPEAFEYVDRWPDKNAKDRAMQLFERADTFDPDTIGGRDDYGNKPPFVRFNQTAQGVFVDWFTQFNRDRVYADTHGLDSAPLSAHFGKIPGLLGKLVLNLHVADDPGSREVSERTLYKALAWLDYLEAHARRVYHAVDRPETGTAEMLLSKLKQGHLPDKFKAWEISRKNWQGLGDGDAVKQACRLLFEYGWLIEVDPGGATGGRPADPVYRVSPAAGGRA